MTQQDDIFEAFTSEEEYIDYMVMKGYANTPFEKEYFRREWHRMATVKGIITRLEIIESKIDAIENNLIQLNHAVFYNVNSK